MKKLIYLFAATLSVVACNNEEISSLQEGKNLEVKFTSNLTGYDSQVVSRLSGTSFDQGDEVAIWPWSLDGSTPPFDLREVFKAGTDGKLSSDKTFTYASGDSEISFYAVYPASVCLDYGIPQQINLNLETNEEGYQSLPDFMTAIAARTKENPVPNLFFSRECSKISVAVCNDGVDLSKAKLYVKAKKGGVFKWYNAVSVTTPEGAVPEDIRIPLVTVESFTDNELYGNTIVAPQILEGECIGIKLNDETETKYVSFPKIELNEGYKYCFNINTRKNGAGDVEISIDSKVNESSWGVGVITPGEVVVDEIRELIPGDNLITNSDFESGTYPWFGWGEGSTREQSSYGEGCNSNYSFKITNPSKVDSWEVQAAWFFSEPLIYGATYRLTMDIKGTVAGFISAAIQDPENGFNYACVFPGIGITTDDWTHYEFDKVLDGEGAVKPTRFVFNIGDYVGTIFIDNVTLCELTKSE